MEITVPPLPAGQTGWRKTVANLTDATGGNCVEGEFLNPGDVVDIPTGTLLVAVDKKTTGWTAAYRSGNRVPVQEVTVTLYVAGAGGPTPPSDGLSRLWGHHYKTAKAAFGATTRKELSAWLAQCPAPGGQVTVIDEARRPNRREDTCRWCSRRVPAETGHVVGHGDTATVEHWKTCPTREAHSHTGADVGTTCGLCGVVLIAQGGYRAPDAFAMVMVREGEGRWEARHLPSVRCTENRPESAEEARARVAAAREAEQAEFRAQRAAEQERERKAAERKAARLAREKAAEEAEVARVTGLTRTGRATKTLNDKGIGGSERVRLDEYTDNLSDGSTTTRWGVVRYYESGGGWGSPSLDGDYDVPLDETAEFTNKRDAQAAYRAIKFTPVPREDYAGSGGDCANGCGGTARFVRYDSSGIKGKVCARCNREEDYILSFA